MLTSKTILLQLHLSAFLIAIIVNQLSLTTDLSFWQIGIISDTGTHPIMAGEDTGITGLA